MDHRVGREAQYEVFAAEFSDHAKDGFFNAYLDRPACLELLGDVAGLRVLDAACGPGLYAEELTRRGAHVSGFDQSPSMVALSRDRVPQADFRVHDAGEPLQWLTDSSMDVILFALALEYIDERIVALREMHRVLKLSHGGTGAVAPASDRGLAASRWQLLRRPRHRGDLERGLACPLLDCSTGADL